METQEEILRSASTRLATAVMLVPLGRCPFLVASMAAAAPRPVEKGARPMERRTAVFLALVMLLGCKELPGRILTGPGLRPGPTAARLTAPPSLKVVHASPAGGGEDVQEVVVIFNRAMASGEIPLLLSPPVEGAARWIGEHTLAFVAREPLPEGRYEAVVPATARSADGVPLGAPHRWSFLAARSKPGEPARPRASPDAEPLKVRGVRVLRGRALTEGRKLVVRFNGPVAASELARRARFLLQDGSAVGVVAENARTRRIVWVTPVASLPKGPAVRFLIDAGLRAEDGRGPLAQGFEAGVATQADLQVWWVTCPRSPHAPLRIRFSEDVDAAQVAGRIRIAPQVPLRVLTDESRGPMVALGATFAAGQTYEIEIPAGLPGKDAAPLSRARTQSCGVPVPTPRVRFAVEGTLVEAAAPKHVPVWLELVPKLAVRLRPIGEDQVAEAMRRRDGAKSIAVLHEETLAGSATGRRQVLVDPSPVLPGGRGISLVEVEGLDAADQPLQGTRQRLLLNITDLGLTTKQSKGGTLVWVTRLSSGAPVAGAKVVMRGLNGELLGSAETDADGVAQVVAAVRNRWAGSFVFAHKDGDLAWIRTSENQWMFMPSSFDVPEYADDVGWQPGQPPVLRGLLFTERGIYRPGETVRLKGIARKETQALETEPGARVRLTVTDSQGEEVLARELSLSEFGTFSLDVPLSEAAPLGVWRATAHVGNPEWQRAIQRDFRVEEFRTPDFEVKVRPDRRDWFPGERPRAVVHGRYFFGSNMRGAPVAWTVTSRPSGFVPPKHPGYVWKPGGSPWEMRHVEPESTQVLSDEGSLDERGERLIEITAAEPSRIYTVEARVTGLDRTVIAGRAEVVVHPASFYLGVLAEWTFLELTETFRADLVAVAPDGSRVSGVPIEGVVYHGDWESVRRLHQGGTASFSSQAAPKVAGRCALRSGEAPARCEFKPQAGGLYVLWAKAVDAAGRKVETSIEFYVLGPTTTSWAASDAVKITLRADRHEYRVGDTARILVQNPFPEAEALVTVERERVLGRFRQKLVGPAPAVRVPVTEDLLPNVYVSVVLVRGRVPGPFQATGDDPRRPLMRVGHALLRVSPESRRMKVEVVPEKSEYRPGDEVTVRVRTAGPHGEVLPGELTVWAVDEGVLSLVAYKTPDPVGAFHGFRALGIMTSDTRYRYLRRRSFEEKGRETGGDGGGPSEPVHRKVFKAVVFFDPSVRTDASGEATVRFKLPDNLTTFRVMAVAVTKGQRFGSGDAKIVSTKRLLLQPALPRLVRAGDRLEAGVVVHNRTGEPGEAVVRLAASGLELLGPAERSLRVEPGRGAEVRFTMHAGAPGVAKLAFQARLGRERDALEVTRLVHLATVTESVGLSGEASGEAVRHAIGPVPGARADVGGLEVVLSGSRLAGLAPALASLMEYPYGCAEQTTSRLLPLIALREVAEVTGDRARRDVGPMIAAGLRRLATFQAPSGGFSLWPGGEHVDPWVSAYVMFALAEAKTRGHEIEAKVLEAGARHLKSALRQKRLDGMARAYALYALSSLGAAEAAYAATLFEEREALGLPGRAVLARALIRMGERERAATLVTELAGAARLDGGNVRFPDDERDRWRWYGSPVRTQALVLEALAAYEPGHALVKLLAESILAAREGGRWRTTQEAAYALFALAAAERAETATARRGVTVFVNGKRRLEARFGPGEKAFRKLWVSMGDLGAGSADLVVAPQGGPIRYAARLVYAPAEPPREGRDHGLALWRTYERVKSPAGGAASFATVSADTLAAGDLVRVTVHVLVPWTMEHVVVDDPLPAGLEAVNVALATEAKEGAEPGRDHLFTHRELRDDRVVLYARKLAPGLYRRTYLARATTPGRFGVPALRGEAMYRPEWSGSTAAATLTVAPPAGGVASR